MKVFGIAGYSGAGKTTLIEKLLSEMAARGLRVSVIKQSHHDVALEPDGKDSWRHRQAGAFEVLLTSPKRWMLAAELRGTPEPGLSEHLGRLADCDLVLVEGYRHTDLPKLEVYRTAAGRPRLAPDDSNVLALAGDAEEERLPRFALDDAAGLTDFILEHARPFPG